jgi:hypothetical protein
LASKGFWRTNISESEKEEEQEGKEKKKKGKERVWLRFFETNKKVSRKGLFEQGEQAPGVGHEHPYVPQCLACHVQGHVGQQMQPSVRTFIEVDMAS